LAKEYKIWKQYCEEMSLSSGCDTQNEGKSEGLGISLRKGNKRTKEK